jgi:hypothetical protein
MAQNVTADFSPSDDSMAVDPTRARPAASRAAVAAARQLFEGGTEPRAPGAQGAPAPVHGRVNLTNPVPNAPYGRASNLPVPHISQVPVQQQPLENLYRAGPDSVTTKEIRRVLQTAANRSDVLQQNLPGMTIAEQENVTQGRALLLQNMQAQFLKPRLGGGSLRDKIR